jgi:hypothetical protein
MANKKTTKPTTHVGKELGRPQKNVEEIQLILRVVQVDLQQNTT